MATEPRGTAARFDPAGMTQLLTGLEDQGASIAISRCTIGAVMAAHPFQHGRKLPSPRAELLRAGRGETNRAALDLTAA
jgi:hypothetical protein